MMAPTQKFTSCPICGGNMIPSVQRRLLPVLQNVVYPSYIEARDAEQGELDIQICSACGFATNAAFDPTRVRYDLRYDNSVPSPTFVQYYRKLAAYLGDKYVRQGGLVLDIGCGNGAFLHILTSMFPRLRGVGVDPSCDANTTERLRFIRDVFRPTHVSKAPELVICRHTLEHIPQPTQFLQLIRQALPQKVPVFIEVPDAEWIVRNRAFWDWCYEHVNYFVPENLSIAMAQAGFVTTASSRGFGDQYLWIEGITSACPPEMPKGRPEFVAEVSEYARNERDLIAGLKSVLSARKQAGEITVVWGMATKGVEFLNLVDPEATLIDYCVDINERKQGKYTPVTARRIHSPSALQTLSRRCAIVVMNPVYEPEIREECGRMRLDASFVSI